MKLLAPLMWLVIATAFMTACTYRVHESNVVIPRAAPSADIDAFRKQFPEYRIDAVRIPASGNALIYSLRFLRPDALATVMYFGGNGYTLAKFAPRTVNSYLDTAVNVILVDHRGYGGSTGVPTVDNLMGDALLVYDHTLEDPALGTLPIILHGHSLGSFMAGHVAAKRTLSGLILEASVTSTEEWTKHLRSKQSPWIRLLVWRVVPTGSLAGQGNRDVAAGINEPVLFVVGAEDDVTPSHFAQALFDITPLPKGSKELVIIPCKNHMNATDSTEFKRAFAAFTTRVVNHAARQDTRRD